ncbi:MAG: class I SAM-dependent methyltransferase, partial [Candidatus Bathycorpusculaceae bacterium]
MSLEEEIEKCSKIHDNVAEFWNWAYFGIPYHEPSSWVVGEYIKQLKPDVERRVPVVIREIAELLEQHTDDSFSILDVGCGVGGCIHRALSLLPEKYPNIKFRATGIDISSEMIEYASKNLRDFDVELICGSITNSDLKFKNEPFDVAIMMVTLSFYTDKNAKEILRAIRSKLKKGGCLLVMDFAWTYTWAGLKLFSKPLQKLTDMLFSQILGEPFHFKNRTEEHLKALLNDSGFEVTKS